MSFDKHYSWRWILLDQWKYKMKKIDITKWVLWFWFAYTLVSFVSYTVFGIKLWVTAVDISRSFFLLLFHVGGFLAYPIYASTKGIRYDKS